MTEAILPFFEAQHDAMVELLTTLIGYESFTQSKPHVDALGAFMEGQFHALGATSVTRLPHDVVGDILLAKWHEDVPGKPILFLIHIDTVWPIGTLDQRPVTIDAQGRLFGPGAIDMKGGITLVLSVMRALQQRGARPARPVWVLMTTDEEVGSIHSQDALLRVARECGLVLVMEPATPEGALKTWRKGIATFEVSVEGRASHAGNRPEQGINAIVELSQQIVRLSQMNDLKNGISVSVTMVNGGSAGNVIPAYASAFVDTRALTIAGLDALCERVTGLHAITPGATLTVRELHKRPPMERDAKMQRAFTTAKALGEPVGVTAREDGSGGGSDGNLTAAIGIPTLDGLGPTGDGLHALNEHVVLRSLPQRAALLTAIIEGWPADA